MSKKRTINEQITDLQIQREKIKEQAKARENALRLKENALKSKQSQAERKARTKRLIECGAVVESVLGRPIEKEDLPKLQAFLSSQESRGGFFSKAMAK